jgi:hypothetical protein
VILFIRLKKFAKWTRPIIGIVGPARRWEMHASQVILVPPGAGGSVVWPGYRIFLFCSQLQLYMRLLILYSRQYAPRAWLSEKSLSEWRHVVKGKFSVSSCECWFCSDSEERVDLYHLYILGKCTVLVGVKFPQWRVYAFWWSSSAERFGVYICAFLLFFRGRSMVFVLFSVISAVSWQFSTCLFWSWYLTLVWWW